MTQQFSLLSYCKQFSHSMLGQILILSTLFLGVLFYFVVLQPTLEYYNEVNKSPYIYDPLWDDIVAFETDLKNSKESGPLSEFPNFKRLMAKNPDFKYYIQLDSVIQTNNEVLSDIVLEINSSVRNFLNSNTLSQEERMSVCINIGEKEARDNISGNEAKYPLSYFSAFICDDTIKIYELSGASENIESEIHGVIFLWSDWILVFSIGGVLIIALTIIRLNVHSITRLTDITQSFDANDLDKQLPRAGVPQEVMPLIGAINQMLGRVKETQAQHDFFLSTAAHEMRTPLTILRGRMDILPDSDLKQQLIQDTRVLIILTNQLLKLMRSGVRKQLTEQIDIVKCCKATISDRAPLIIEKGITIGFSTDKESLLLLGDADLMEVAVGNLIDNAVSFSKSGDEIIVALSEDGRLSFSDQGPGIALDILPNLFNAFAKFPIDRNGHGLGLAITKSIAMLHNAEICARNNEKQGATFEIQFFV